MEMENQRSVMIFGVLCTPKIITLRSYKFSWGRRYEMRNVAELFCPGWHRRNCEDDAS